MPYLNCPYFSSKIAKIGVIYMIRHRYRFCLPETKSPTYFNLSKYLKEQGWNRTRFNWLSHFTEQNFKFDLPAAECLEFKNLLAALIEKYNPEIMPETYCIDDHNWSNVMSHIADRYYMDKNYLKDKIDNLIWILKPAFLNNGKHIKVFHELSQIEQHYLSANRLGGAHVLQKYIAQPHLLRGHKYSIRMFVVLTNYAGAYLYPHGYFNVALHPYRPTEFFDLRSHLTNEHLTDEESNVKQIPTTRMEIFSSFYPKIKNIIAKTIHSLEKEFPHAFLCDKKRALAIFGFDFIVDQEMQLWLLEANHGPCFPIEDEHPLQKYLYRDFWLEFIENFVKPIILKQPVEQIKYSLFEAISYD
jgi:hypothetical protein